jgi:hypothetical protein
VASGWPFGNIVDQIGETARQVLPNKMEERRLELQERELDQKSVLAQIDVNKTEAAHANLFVAGWRPFIGWTGGFALAYSFIAGPLITQLFGLEMPNLDVGELFTLVAGLLGLGAMRSFEKSRGVATSVGGQVLAPVKPVDPNLEGLY